MDASIRHGDLQGKRRSSLAGSVPYEPPPSSQVVRGTSYSLPTGGPEEIGLDESYSTRVHSPSLGRDRNGDSATLLDDNDSPSEGRTHVRLTRSVTGSGRMANGTNGTFGEMQGRQSYFSVESDAPMSSGNSSPERSFTNSSRSLHGLTLTPTSTLTPTLSPNPNP